MQVFTDSMLGPLMRTTNETTTAETGSPPPPPPPTIVEEGFVYKEETHLTVSKTSLFFAGDGFAAYDTKGVLVFRVDTYGGPEPGNIGELVLMDAGGRCILTVRRKRPSLHHRWEGFIGEGTGQKPLFSVRRSSMIRRSTMTVEVYGNPGEEYLIEGSFASRKCTIYNSEKQVVAEIRRKVDAYAKVVVGKDAFQLSVKPGFDVAFAMGLVLVLDQIRGANEDDAEYGSKVGVEPPNEASKFSP